MSRGCGPTGIISATEWANFFALRVHPDAQPEFQKLARQMLLVYTHHEPTPVGYGKWHLPLIFEDDLGLPIETLKKVSAGRCARVSYLTHDGKRDIEADVELADRLSGNKPGHMSPFEHVATPYLGNGRNYFCANFRDWVQMRSWDFPNENITDLAEAYASLNAQTEK